MQNLRVIDSLIWCLIAACAAAVTAAIAGPFEADWPSLTKPIGVAICVAALGVVYDRFRDEQNIASALSATSQIVIFSALGIPLSYITQSLSFPALDAVYASVDRALGLNWRWLCDWMMAQAELKAILSLAYSSLQVQAIIAILALSALGHLARLRVFVLAYITIALSAIAIATVIPAEGIWTTYGIANVDKQAPLAVSDLTKDFLTLHLLRTGELRTLSALGGQGIISFPSVHAALAILFVVSVWPVSYLRWIALLANGLMLASVPIHGSHYFADILGGAAVAVFSWWLALTTVNSLSRARSSTSAVGPVLAGAT